MSRFLRTNTAIRLTVGPALDATDGITPETALTVTNCKLTFIVDTANVPTLVLDTAPTASAGNNDMVHISGDDAGFYDLELTAANTNYLGRAMLSITDATTHCPIFHEFMILPAMIYDSMVLGTDRLDTNVTHIGDTAQTARDLGTSVLVSSGTGTGQLDVTSGVVKGDVSKWLGTVASTPTVAGVPNVNTKTWNDLATVALPLVPTTAGRTLDVTAANKVNGVVTVDTLTTYTGNTVQTGDAYARLGAPVGASISADIAAKATATNLAAVKTVVDAIQVKTDNLPSNVKKNTALSNFPFFMVDSGDHITGKTGLTVTATRSLDGAAFGACANAVSEISNGFYKINLAAADLNGDTVSLKFAASGADTRGVTILTSA